MYRSTLAKIPAAKREALKFVSAITELPGPDDDVGLKACRRVGFKTFRSLHPPRPSKTFAYGGIALALWTALCPILYLTLGPDWKLPFNRGELILMWLCGVLAIFVPVFIALVRGILGMDKRYAAMLRELMRGPSRIPLELHFYGADDTKLACREEAWKKRSRLYAIFSVQGRWVVDGKVPPDPDFEERLDFVVRVEAEVERLFQERRKAAEALICAIDRLEQSPEQMIEINRILAEQAMERFDQLSDALTIPEEHCFQVGEVPQYTPAIKEALTAFLATREKPRISGITPSTADSDDYSMEPLYDASTDPALAERQE